MEGGEGKPCWGERLLGIHANMGETCVSVLGGKFNCGRVFDAEEKDGSVVTAGFVGGFDVIARPGSPVCAGRCCGSSGRFNFWGGKGSPPTKFLDFVTFLLREDSMASL